MVEKIATRHETDEEDSKTVRMEGNEKNNFY